MTMKVVQLMQEVKTSTKNFPDVFYQGENEIAPETVEPIDTLYINPLTNDFPYVLYQGENEKSSNIENALIEEHEPLLMESFEIFDDNDEKMPESPLKNSFPYVLYQGENEEASEIDPAEFEVDEPELIEIFQNSKNTFSLLDNPCPQDLENNPFLETNPLEVKNANPFKKSLDKSTIPFYGALEEHNNSVTKPCAPQMKNGFSPEESSSNEIAKHNPANPIPQVFDAENTNSYKESMEASTHVSPAEFSPKVSRPKHILKRKVNSFVSWIKAKCTFPSTRRYEKLN